LAGSSRIGAVILVTVLSCLVLGGVWGVVLLLLPESDVLPETAPSSSATPPIVSPSSRSSPVKTVPDAPLPPAAAAVQTDRAPAVQEPPRPSSIDTVGLPVGMEAKCDLEIEALCPEGEGARHACLQRKAAQLSQPCRPMLREKLVRIKERMQQMRVACEADRRQFCREGVAGGEELVQCLESHAQSVSDQCFQLLPKRGRLLN